MQGNVWYINGKLAANILPAFHPNDHSGRNWDEDQASENMQAAKPVFMARFGLDPDLRHTGKVDPDEERYISDLERQGGNEDVYWHIAQADYTEYHLWERGDLRIEVFPYELKGIENA